MQCRPPLDSFPQRYLFGLLSADFSELQTILIIAYKMPVAVLRGRFKALPYHSTTQDISSTSSYFRNSFQFFCIYKFDLCLSFSLRNASHWDFPPA